jgi:hypothetical protein
MHDPADDPAIVYPLDAAHIPRQIRPNSSPLLVAQPKQILAHDPNPLPKTNQDRILRAQKLMSFDPNHDTGLRYCQLRNQVSAASMTVRTSSKTVTFAHPFLLKGVDRILAAGDYRVVTDEELFEELSFPVYRRVATMILVPAESDAAP